MKKNFINIIIHYYNRKKTILRTLKSITKNFKKDELGIILIDDNSNDNTSYIARNYLNNNNYNFKFVKNSKNKGTNYCKNLGLNLSNSIWTIFLDSDDEIIIKSDKLKKILMLNSKFKIVCLSSISSNSNFLNSFKKNKVLSLREFINYGKGSEVLDCTQKIRIYKPYDEKIKLSGEIVGWSRLIKKCNKIVICKEIGRKYNESEDISRISNIGKIKMSKNYLRAHTVNLKENFQYMNLEKKISTFIKIIFYYFYSKVFILLKRKKTK
jgi:glycosyltransferase involved in cell wall biosynthesis